MLLNSNSWKHQVGPNEKLTVKALRVQNKESHRERERTEDQHKNHYMIIDRGASEHIMADIDLFHTLADVKEVDLDFPYGSTMSVNPMVRESSTA